MSVKERLKKFIIYKRMNDRQFSLSIGVSAGYVNSISKSIQPDKLNRITALYPELNTGWLLTGEGQMLKQANDNLRAIEDASNSLAELLKFKIYNADDKKLDSMNMGDILFFRLLSKINELENKLADLQKEVDNLKKDDVESLTSKL